MLPLTRMMKSRDSWRVTAVARALTLREERRKTRTLEKRLKSLRQRPRPAPAAPVAPVQSAEVIPLFPTHRIRILCVMLALVAVLSFRSVPRALAQFQPFAALPMPPPHFTSVINWTLRVGLARLRAVAPIAEPWIALLDLSIDVGIQKALVILRVPLSPLERTGAALTLASCECIGCIVHDSWNGESIAAALAKTFEKAGPPKAILRDGGGDLRRGIVLWKLATKLGRVAVISDVVMRSAACSKLVMPALLGFVGL